MNKCRVLMSSDTIFAFKYKVTQNIDRFFFQSFAWVTVIYSIVNVTIIEIGWTAIRNGISEIPHIFFIISGRFISRWLFEYFKTWQRMTCSWRCISDTASKWSSRCIWKIASYISSITNMYVLLDKFAAKM